MATTTSSNGTTITIAACALCEHDFNMHVPPCPPDAPCGGSEVGYCLQCWDEGKDFDTHVFAFRYVATH